MLSYEDIVVKTAFAGLRLQLENGAMPSGVNGPHRHTMTPARNTGHWAILFLHAYLISNDSKLKKAATKCLNLLISSELWPMMGAFWHRNHVGRNKYNGLIGQSWTMESLFYGWKILNNSNYRFSALKVFSQHLYDEKLNLWHGLDVDGSVDKVEYVLNQQVWLAGMGAILAENDFPDIREKVSRFLLSLPGKVILRNHGRLPRLLLNDINKVERIRQYLAENYIRKRAKIREIEYGYHVFSLTGFAYLFAQFPEHSFWQSHLFLKALNYPFSENYQNCISDNPFGFPYNVPGFELPYVFLTFRELIDAPQAELITKAMLVRQIERHYNFHSNFLELNTNDPWTLSARFYEFTRIAPAFVKMSLRI